MPVDAFPAVRTGLRLLVLLVQLAGVSVSVRAGGFQVVEHSARGTGLGGAQVASIGDATSIHLNPAALAFLQGTNFSFGTTVIVPEQKFSGVLPDRDEAKMQAQVLFPPNIYLTHSFGTTWGLGLAVNIPYAEKTEWDGGWAGRRLATKSELRLVCFTPSIGIKINDHVSFGAGVHVRIPKILFEHKIPALQPPPPGQTFPDATATYEADGNPQIGVQLGLLARVYDGIVLGASFSSRSEMTLDDGRVSYRGTADTLLPSGKFSTSLLAPAKFQAGVAWDPFDWLHAELDAEYTLWSALKTIDVYYFQPIAPTHSFSQNWNNTLNFRYGIEVSLSDLSIRGGFRLEKTPIPDDVLTPGVPDANAHAFSIGVGYRVAERLTMDFAYESVQFDDRLVTTSSLEPAGAGSRFNGIYSSRTAAVALNVSYSWN